MEVRLTGVTLETIKAEATAHGITPEDLEKIAIHDFGAGRLTLIAYPGNPSGETFLKRLSENHGGTRFSR